MRVVAATKFHCRDKDFHKISPVHTKRFVAAMCRHDMLLQLVSRRTCSHGVICCLDLLLQLVAQCVPKFQCGVKSLRVSSSMAAQKKSENSKLSIEKRGKLGKFVLKRIEKSIVLSSTQIYSLPAPHLGYNKGYESLVSTFGGFRSTFTVQKK